MNLGSQIIMRTDPMPIWVKTAIDLWTSAAEMTNRHLFLPVKDSRLILPAVFEYGPDRNGTVQTD